MTFVIIDGWTITVGSVGDSRCILDTQGGVVSLLTVDHRLEENVEERERVTASGGEVGRLNVFGGNEVWSCPVDFIYMLHCVFGLWWGCNVCHDTYLFSF